MINSPSKDTPSIATALQYGYEILQTHANYRLEAELLLSHLLQVSRTQLYTRNEQLIPNLVWRNYQQLCLRRQNGEPIAYLLGYKEFWSLQFEVNEATLIPRPETELLVAITLQKLPEKSNVILAELGVGSGAVAIALAIERPQWRIYGSDISATALSVAKRNMEKHRVQNLILIHSDWCSNLPTIKFDALVSNPPYIAQDDPHLQNLLFEPQAALISGPDGLDAIRKIIHQATSYLKQNGVLILEHGYDQSASVRNLLADSGFVAIESHCDLNGIERVTNGIFKE